MDCCLTHIALTLSGCSIATLNCTDQHVAGSVPAIPFTLRSLSNPTLAEFDLKQNNKPPTTFTHPKPTAGQVS